MLTVPVYRVLNGQVILYKDFKIVSFLDLDQWARLLAIDEVYFPGETIYKVLASILSRRRRGQCLKSLQDISPGLLVALWRVKL